MDDKVRVIVRADLPVAAQAVQATHAALLFASAARMTPASAERATVALLSVDDEAALLDLAARAVARDVDVAAFYEPDLGGSLTAIALAAGPNAKRICRGLRLALQQQEDAMTT
jgi:hypothetical protein